MSQKAKDVGVVFMLVGMLSLVPPVLFNATASARRIECNVYNVHWDCYEAGGRLCKDHCPSGTQGCGDET